MEGQEEQEDPIYDSAAGTQIRSRRFSERILIILLFNLKFINAFRATKHAHLIRPCYRYYSINFYQNHVKTHTNGSNFSAQKKLLIVSQECFSDQTL